jgi:hypothetical protein
MLQKSIIKAAGVFAMVIACVMVVGCSDDGNPAAVQTGTGNENAMLITRLDQGVSYIQAVDLSKATGTVSQENATQVMSDWAFTYPYGSKVYVGGYDAAEVTKYGVASNGSVKKEGALEIPANSWPAGMEFVSSTKAYVSLYATGHVVIFNPSTMEKISTIDLNPYAQEGFLVSPGNMLIQGNRLIVALHQMAGQFICDPKAHVAIIDINADTVIAHITDTRAAWAASRESVPTMFVDDEGDAYISCSAIFGMGGTSLREGVLRIKSGAVEFDPDYYWEISTTTIEGESAAAAGQTGALYSMVYVSGTKGVGMIINLGYMAPDDDMMTGHYFKPVAFDFLAKTMKVLDIPAGGGYGHGMAKHNDKFLFAFEISGGNGVYEYDPVTSTVKKLFSTELDPCYIVEIEK